MPTAADLNKLKVEELQKLLKEKGLPTTGKKADLVQVLEHRQGAPRAQRACTWLSPSRRRVIPRASRWHAP
jgi:hypothetical protein